MNPNTTVKPWLLACGKQFGVNDAREYRYPDAKARAKQDPYFTYALSAAIPQQVGHQDLTTKTSYVANRKGYQKHFFTATIDLWDSQDGLYELAAIAVAAQQNPIIRAVFAQQCEFNEVQSITDLTTFDDDRINYHHQMICTFDVNVEFSLDETNAVVEEIKLTLESGGYEWTIDDTGYQ